MEERFHRYNLVARLTHLIASLLLVLLYATGLRLMWFSGSHPMFESRSILDKIVPVGQVYHWHLVWGVLLVACSICYFVDMMLTGQTARLTALFTDKKRHYRKKLFYIFVLAVASMTIISGISLYVGSYEGAGGYMFMKGIHHYGMSLLAIFIVVHFIDVLSSRDVSVKSIFYGYIPDRFLNFRSLIPSVLVAAIIGGGLWLLIGSPIVLVSMQVDSQPTIDGVANDNVWNRCDSVRVSTAVGANFDTGVSEVTIKSFHNKLSIFFLIQWQDADRSFNRNLIKNESGWSVQTSEYSDLFGERVYFEDKLALSFHRKSGGCMSTCHLGSQKKMGLHYTDGDTADVWQWCAISTNPINRANDGWWKSYDNDSLGGRHLDNLAFGGYFENMNAEWLEPIFLPVHPVARHWINPHHEFVQPYFFGEDSFSIGAEIPAVIVTQFVGDRGDVRAVGRWDDDMWTLELSRSLNTGSPFDYDLREDSYIGIATFDNAQSKHAFHLCPVKLVVE